ncbi:MAG TPA: ATP-binding protein [Planctomycetota bacterium]|nr:ATP-binding protein [Planctomycetota bacterium]
MQCGRIRGANRTDIVDRMEYHGPMLGAVDAVMDFLRKNAFLSARFGDVRRKDVWSIPIEPLREVVVNALVHANYAEPGTPVRIAFYDDRIEVEGPGLLVAGMTIPGMRNASRLRNPSLARVFRAAGLMENFGTGVRRVYEQLAADGLPEPKVEEVIDRLRFTVYVPSHAPDAGLGADEKHQDRALRHQDEAPSQSVASLSSTEAVVLRQVRVDPASRAELMTALGITNQTRAFRRHIEPLLESGLLERTLPDKPTSRDQRYRITELGLVALAGQEDAE